MALTKEGGVRPFCTGYTALALAYPSCHTPGPSLKVTRYTLQRYGVGDPSAAGVVPVPHGLGRSFVGETHVFIVPSFRPVSISCSLVFTSAGIFDSQSWNGASPTSP